MSPEPGHHIEFFSPQPGSYSIGNETKMTTNWIKLLNVIRGTTWGQLTVLFLSSIHILKDSKSKCAPGAYPKHQHANACETTCIEKGRNQGKNQIRSVAQSCPTLCDPMNRRTPGLPVHHQLPEFIQTHVHRVSDAIQPSHPLLSPSPPAPNPSQHQSLFQWVNSSHEVAKVLEFQL